MHPCNLWVYEKISWFTPFFFPSQALFEGISRGRLFLFRSFHKKFLTIRSKFCVSFASRKRRPINVMINEFTSLPTQKNTTWLNSLRYQRDLATPRVWKIEKIICFIDIQQRKILLNYHMSHSPLFIHKFRS